MRRRIGLIALLTALLALSSDNLFAQERWVYSYDGPGSGGDRANSIVMGTDGNLYAAGASEGGGNQADITVISLTPSGDERWVYRWSSGSWDEAFSITMGSDGNLYTAGHSWGGGYRYYFTVISLTPSGGERWFYRYYGPGDGWDHANSIIAGTDGNLYAAGASEFLMAPTDFIVISLAPSGPAERWAYRYNGPASEEDEAYCIVMGTDGNLYAAGYSTGALYDFTVISLDTSGTERWVYRYNGPADSIDAAHSIVMGTDGNLYAAGNSWGTGTRTDFTVISLTPSGGERWVYRHNGPGDSWDAALSIAVGTDGNLYAAGNSSGTGTRTDFTVISLTPAGGERWIYSYNGPADSSDLANSIVVGTDGNLYAAGYSKGIGTDRDFTVVSLTHSGGERWVYRYNASGDASDAANSIAMGTDGNLYAAGYSAPGGTGLDFTVISLALDARDVGIASVDEPPDTIACDDTVLVAATVCNYGNTVDTFEVEAVIDSSGDTVYADTQTVTDLLPDSCRPVSFADWPVPPVHGVSYTVTVTSMLPTDINPANDTASKGTLAWCPPGIEEQPGNDQLTMAKSQLLQNYPNPFTHFTTISYRLTRRHGDLSTYQRINLSVYDLTGRLVRTLVDEPSNHSTIQSCNQVIWDGTNETGQQLGPGIYFYSLRAGEFTATKKLAILR